MSTDPRTLTADRPTGDGWYDVPRDPAKFDALSDRVVRFLAQARDDEDLDNLWAMYLQRALAEIRWLRQTLDPVWAAWQTAKPPCTTCGGTKVVVNPAYPVSTILCPACVDHPGVQPFTEWVAGVVGALNAPHADEHLIEFRNDGWTIQHPVAERLDGSMFDCAMANWDGGDIGYRGRYVLYQDDDGQLNIGAEVARQIGGIR